MVPAVTEERRREYEHVVERLRAWAGGAAGRRRRRVVGSWARGEPRMDSDVDAVVLTAVPERYAAGDDWIEAVAGEPAPIVRRQKWGILTDCRVRLASGFEVEYGFVPPSWASTDPLDEGTREVAAHGLRPVHDPTGLLERLARAVRGPG